MNILDLATELGLQPKRFASTNGGEYKASCPKCEGKDRFCLWPKEGVAGKYWCRVCKCKGDAIQFCRDFLKLSYVEACKKINVAVKPRISSKIIYPFKKTRFQPKIIESVSDAWKEAAKAFIERSQKRLQEHPHALEMLISRGFTKETIEKFSLGWNPETIFDNRATWGLSYQLNERGNEKKQWLPRGMVIPYMQNGIPLRIKIRRSDWNAGDDLPKYVEVSGCIQRPSIYGDLEKPMVVMESELDAILIQQFASDLCCCLALGGVGKRPDKQVHELLCKAPIILLALDYDEAGKKEYPFWMSLYPNLRPWPPRKGKSPGDSHILHQVDLRKWISDGLSMRSVKSV